MKRPAAIYGGRPSDDDEKHERSRRFMSAHERFQKKLPFVLAGKTGHFLALILRVVVSACLLLNA
jgi:hypothetical protein